MRLLSQEEVIGSNCSVNQMSEWSLITSMMIAAQRTGKCSEVTQREAVSYLEVNMGWRLFGFMVA